jgi:Abnormal spindle-like microcephaly-assoc'd, ASPM-SPD-2-Hydin
VKYFRRIVASSQLFWVALLSLLLVGGITGQASAQFKITPLSLQVDFGKAPIGLNTAGLHVTVLANGASNVTINSYSISPAPSLNAPFKLVNGWAPVTLPPGAQIVFDIQFYPTVAQTYNGTFTLNIQGANPVTLTLTGVGTGTSAVSQLTPSILTFGSQPVGTTSAPKPLTVKNVGSSPMTVTQIWADPPYLVGGYTVPQVLVPNQNMTVQVQFAPSATGSFPGNINFGYDVVVDNGVAVSGTGTATSAFGITTFPTLPTATQGAAYLASMTANGGTLPLDWSLSSGSKMPAGLSLSSAGSITGTISSSVATGNYHFGVQVIDSSTPPETITEQLTLAVNAPNGSACDNIFFNIPNTNIPLTPLTDLGTSTFLGEQGGLYPNGSNVRPADHDASGVSIGQGIVPLDANGNPDPNGQYVLLAIGMSVAHIDADGLVNRAAGDPMTNPHLVIVNGAQPRGDADLFADPNNAFWNPIFSDFLPNSGVTANQVVAAWIMDDNPKPGGTFPGYMQVLQANWESIAQNLHTKFPNLKLAYFLPRIYAGYSNGVPDAPDAEPIAYEVGFSTKWAIEDQLDGLPSLNFDPDKGPVMAPWMDWGPYTWANGLLARNDGLVWSCQEYQPDGHHPDQYTGKWKDAGFDLNFLKTDDTTRHWFLNPAQLVALSVPSLNFGNQTVGTTSSPHNVTVTNNQGLPLIISSITASGDFAQTNNCGSSLIAGGTCTISVTFTPTVAGNRSGTLTITDDAASSPQMVSLSGVGVGGSAPIVSLSTSTLTFSPQVIGTTSAGQNVTVTNIGSANLTVASIAASAGFAETDNCVGVNVAPSGSCSISATFTPALSGPAVGEITLMDNAGNSPQLIGLSGSGVYPVTLTPTFMNFGSLTVGTTSSPKTLTVTNRLGTTVNLSFATTGDYAAAASGANPCGSALKGLSRCTLNVTFTPSMNGTINGSLTVSYNGNFSPQSLALSGSGTGANVAPLTFSPANPGAFGNVVVGTTSPTKSVTVKNVSNSAVNISSISATGNFTGVAGGAQPCGGNLAAKATCTILITFTPNTPGSATSALTILDNSNVSPQLMTMTGTGILPVTMSPSSLTFAAQTIGTTSSPQIVTLKNNQASMLTINGITASGDYLVVTAGSNPCGSVLTAGNSCTIGVEFSPVTTGTIIGTLSVAHNANFSPQAVALSGIGQ